MSADEEEKKSVTRPQAARIVKAQALLLEEIQGKFEDFNPYKNCWACGRKTSLLERAHLIPDSADGPCTPDNFILLCSGCHREQPDNASVEAQLLWLHEHEPRDMASVSWMLTNVIKPLQKRCEEMAPGTNDALLGAWIDSMGDDPVTRTKQLIKLFQGAYPSAGRALPQGMLNTAKYEVFSNFDTWIARKKRELLTEWTRNLPPQTGPRTDLVVSSEDDQQNDE